MKMQLLEYSMQLSMLKQLYNLEFFFVHLKGVNLIQGKLL
jgi:hypothetical protein